MPDTPTTSTVPPGLAQWTYTPDPPAPTTTATTTAKSEHHVCFFLGGPHHNSVMRRPGKPSSSWGTLERDLARSPSRGESPAHLTWGLYRLEATIGDGLDGPIPGLFVGDPIAIYAWRGEPLGGTT